MILYDWKKVKRITGYNPYRIYLALKVLSGIIPYNDRSELYPYYLRDFSGNSYLINPEGLLDLSTEFSFRERAEYFILASFRNKAEYIMSGNASLPLEHSPVNIETIKRNRLLKIKNGRILFKLEEEALGEQNEWQV